jgi:hypothetical protein
MVGCSQSEYLAQRKGRRGGQPFRSDSARAARPTWQRQTMAFALSAITLLTQVIECQARGARAAIAAVVPFTQGRI